MLKNIFKTKYSFSATKSASEFSKNILAYAKKGEFSFLDLSLRISILDTNQFILYKSIFSLNPIKASYANMCQFLGNISSTEAGESEIDIKLQISIAITLPVFILAIVGLYMLVHGLYTLSGSELLYAGMAFVYLLFHGAYINYRKNSIKKEFIEIFNLTETEK